MPWGPETRDKIVEKLAEGYSLRAICREADMPDWRTVIRWQHEDEAFANRCLIARGAGADVGLENMTQIEMRVLRGKLKPDAANVVLSNMRWRMEKLKPRVFGQKLDLNHGGSIGFSLRVRRRKDAEE